MKLYDKHKHSLKLLMIIFGTKMIFGISGLIKNHPDFFSYFIILISLFGIGLSISKLKFPYLEIDQLEIIKYGLFKKRMKLAEIISIENRENTLIIRSEASKIKIKRDLFDVLEIRKFEEFIINEIECRV